MQPLTLIVQFTRIIFDIPFHRQLSCPRSFVVLISCSGSFVSSRSKMSKRKCLSIKQKKLILQEVDKGVKKKGIALKFGIPPNSLSIITKNRDNLQNYDSSRILVQNV
ncbi:tigger transposable element-derived protein 4 [Trichonephila clavipes]|nr:tigger transposable element-derived protein 4 [Trichonephila clavipes]